MLFIIQFLDKSLSDVSFKEVYSEMRDAAFQPGDQAQHRVRISSSCAVGYVCVRVIYIPPDCHKECPSAWEP